MLSWLCSAWLAGTSFVYTSGNHDWLLEGQQGASSYDAARDLGGIQPDDCLAGCSPFGICQEYRSWHQLSGWTYTIGMQRAQESYSTSMCQYDPVCAEGSA